VKSISYSHSGLWVAARGPGAMRRNATDSPGCFFAGRRAGLRICRVFREEGRRRWLLATRAAPSFRPPPGGSARSARRRRPCGAAAGAPMRRRGGNKRRRECCANTEAFCSGTGGKHQKGALLFHTADHEIASEARRWPRHGRRRTMRGSALLRGSIASCGYWRRSRGAPGPHGSPTPAVRRRVIAEARKRAFRAHAGPMTQARLWGVISQTLARAVRECKMRQAWSK